MTPRDLFGLGVRFLGIWLLFRGTTYVSMFVHGKLYPDSGRVMSSAAGDLIFASFDYALALLFLVRADAIARWSYDGATPPPARSGRPHEAPAPGDPPV